MTTITITVRYTLTELKEKYREHFTMKKTEKVTKSDIATWLAVLVESDVQDVGGYED